MMSAKNGEETGILVRGFIRSFPIDVQDHPFPAAVSQWTGPPLLRMTQHELRMGMTQHEL